MSPSEDAVRPGNADAVAERHTWGMIVKCVSCKGRAKCLRHTIRIVTAGYQSVADAKDPVHNLENLSANKDFIATWPKAQIHCCRSPTTR